MRVKFIMSYGVVRRGILFGATLLAVLTTGVSYQRRTTMEEDHALLRMGVEDVAEGIRLLQEHAKVLGRFNSSAQIVKARCLARLIRLDPSLVTDYSRLEELQRDLDVDELYVTDEKGVVIQAVPKSDIGYDLRSKMQSMAFLPAITNQDFVLFQEPVLQGHDAQEHQYTGVARLDKPGVVQVAIRGDHVDAVRQLADVEAFAGLFRIGRGGKASVTRAENRLGTLNQIYASKVGSEAYFCLSILCEGYRVTAVIPDVSGVLGNDWVFWSLCVVDVLLLLLLMFALMPAALGKMGRACHALGVLVGGLEKNKKRKVSVHKILSSPVVVSCALAFVVAVLIAWMVESRVTERNVSGFLVRSMKEMRTDITESVNDMLFFIGNAICRHYKKPELMTPQGVQDVMGRYDIDELNVVNSKGIVIASSLAQLGYDMASHPNSDKFNRLLHGTRTYAQPFRSAIEDSSIVRKYAGVAFPEVKGYIQIGFDQKRMKGDVHYRFENSALDRHIGRTGFYLCADAQTGKIISSGSERAQAGDTLARIGLDVTHLPKSVDTCFQATLYGQRCLCVTDEFAYHRLVAALPLAEIRGSKNVTILITAGILLVVFAGFAFFMGRLSELVSRLRGFIESEKHRQEEDLAIAKTIQISSLPAIFPDEAHFRMFACMGTAREVGGDFYDCMRLEDGTWLFLIADVSGKGIPAAMFMMRAKTLLRSCVTSRENLAEAVAKANLMLSENNDAEMFVTAWIGVFDPLTGVVKFVNAGHNPPVVRRNDGSVTWVKSARGLVLAAMPGVRYKVQELTLQPGDTLLLYTDGVTEAVDRSLALYGEARLEKCVQGASANIVEAVFADVKMFSQGIEQADDITLLSLDYRG